MFSKLLSSVKTEKEREELSQLVEISRPLTDALLKLIERELDDCDVIDEKDFESPSWALKTAYKQGLKKGLTRLREYVII